jgi:membrane-bound lytic murein transglycosylase A
MPARPRFISRRSVAALLCFFSAIPVAAELSPANIPNSQIETVAWTAVNGWADEDHATAFKTFLTSCKAILPQSISRRESRPVFNALHQVCRRAVAAKPSGNEEARAFFEKNFQPVRIATLGETTGLLTGYYEPIVEGSRVQTDEYNVPIYRRPSNLIAKGRRRSADSFPNKGPVGRKVGRRKMAPYYDRAEIEDGILTGRKLEICWLKDPIDAFFIQIQGSARVHLTDGTVMRINYEAHNGWPYTPIGKFLIERGIVPREEMSMARLRQWMEANPEEGKELRRKNRSFVFFRETGLAKDDEPMGAQGVHLTPGRSIAVDSAIHTYGTPFFIEADLPLMNAPPTKFNRLVVAQDTGSAIVGPARADIYFGAGDEAGQVAGRIRNQGRFVMLLPNEVHLLDPDKHIPLPKPRPTFQVAQDKGQAKAQADKKEDKKEKAVPTPKPHPKAGRRR